MVNDELMADLYKCKLHCSTEVHNYFGAVCGVCMCPYYDVTSTQNHIETYRY